MKGRKSLWILMSFLLILEIVVSPLQSGYTMANSENEEIGLTSYEVNKEEVIWNLHMSQDVKELKVSLDEGLSEIEEDETYSVEKIDEMYLVKLNSEKTRDLRLKTKIKSKQDQYHLTINTPNNTVNNHFTAESEKVNEKIESKTREAQAIAPRAGDLNTDISLVAVNKTVESGKVAMYKLVLKTTGSQKKYEDSKLEIDLPIDDVTMFDQDLNELKIAGVVPVYDEVAKKLIYNFENELKSGQTFERMIKVTPENLITDDGKELKTKVTFTDKENEFVDEATVRVKASNSIVLDKTYLGADFNGPLIAPIPNSYIKWSIKVSIPKKETGQMYLKEGSEIIVKDNLPNYLNFSHMITSGQPEPIVNGKEVLWKFKAPSLEKQKEAADELFSTTLEFWTKLDNRASLVGKKIENSAEVTGQFIDEKIISSAKSQATVEVFDSSGNTGELNGGLVYPNHRGPADDKGGFGNNKDKNPNPQVTDEAYLGFAHGLIAMRPGKTYDMLGYETIYNIDKNLKLEQLRTPGNIRLGRTNEEASKQIPITGEVEFDIVGIVNGKVKTLIENAEQGKRYSRTDLNLKTTDHVSQIRYIFKGPVPAGLYAGLHAQYFFSVKEGFIGQVENNFDIKIKPDKRATSDILKGGERLMPDGTWLYSYSASSTWKRLAENTNATIVRKPKLPGPIGEVAVDLLEHTAGEVVSGDNRVKLTLKNNNSSAVSMSKDLEAVVLLPLGVTLKDEANPAYKGPSSLDVSGDYEVLSDDYNGSGRQLVKVKWDENNLRPGNNLTAELDVEITDDAPDTLKFDVYAYTGNADLRAPNNTGTLITDTTLQKDEEDLNNNGKKENRLKSGNVYVKRGSYDLKTQKLVKGELDEDWSDLAKTRPGGDIDYRLTLTNDTGKDLSKMVLVDVLPSVGDLGITDNIARGSKFTPKLQGPITLPAEWEGKVEVKYSQAKTPKRDDLIKNTKYESTTTQLTNPSTAEDPNWVSAGQVKNWNEIHSFKIELVDGAKIIQGTDIDIHFNMKAPEAFELDKELLDQSIDYKERSACNSFAVATEHGQPVEPLQVCAYLDYEIEEPELSKTVNQQRDTYELESTHEKFTWEVKYEFGNHPRNWESVTLSDQIHEILKVTEVKVVDEDGNDVTDKGQVTVSDTNLVEFKLNKEDGNYNYLIDESYTLIIESKIIKETLEKDIHPFTQSNGIPNQAELIINDKPTPSNEVFVKPPEIRGSLDLIKLDKDTKDRLEGAEFELRKDGEKVAEGITNANGDLSFTDLLLGNYELVETKSPEGYRLLAKPIEVSISIDNLNVELEVENEASNWELPASGGMGTLPYYLLGILIMLGVTRYSRKNQTI